MVIYYQMLIAQIQKLSKIALRLRLRMRIHDYHVYVGFSGDDFLCLHRKPVILLHPRVSFRKIPFLWIKLVTSEGLTIQDSEGLLGSGCGFVDCALAPFCFLDLHGRIYQ